MGIPNAAIPETAQPHAGTAQTENGLSKRVFKRVKKETPGLLLQTRALRVTRQPSPRKAEFPATASHICCGGAPYLPEPGQDWLQLGAGWYAPPVRLSRPWWRARTDLSGPVAILQQRTGDQ
jgi:hypothetical protein